VYTLCWSAKGGAGTTVVAAALAVVSARTRPTLLVDLGGDVPSALGVTEPGGPGVGDWLGAPHAPGEQLASLAVEVAPDLHVVSAGSLERGATIDELQAERLALACGIAGAELGAHVVVDAGRHERHTVLHTCASRSLSVVRPCYLALRRALRASLPATAAVVVRDRERAYSAEDVTRVLGIPLAAEVPWDPAVARAVDAGQLLARLPIALSRPLAHIVAPVAT
jgi:hypothetical protein